MATLMESRNYYLAKIILTKKFKFTKEDILEELQKKDLIQIPKKLALFWNVFVKKV